MEVIDGGFVWWMVVQQPYSHGGCLLVVSTPFPYLILLLLSFLLFYCYGFGLLLRVANKGSIFSMLCH